MSSRIRKRTKVNHQHAESSSDEPVVNGTQTPPNASPTPLSLGLSDLAPSLVDLSSTLGLVYGGCCSNVVAYEKLLHFNSKIGSALTFCQMLFVTIQTLPAFLELQKDSYVPTLKQRQVPMWNWLLQVAVLTTGSLLNNWAFAYKVPLPVLIVFRSAGLPVSLIFGFIFLQRRYTFRQTLSVGLVTLGAFLSALSGSGNSSSSLKIPQTPEDTRLYLIGISMLLASLICTAFLGLLQERTYKQYGPAWREGLFYTHFLALPAFLPLMPDIKQGLLSLHRANTHSTSHIPHLPYVILLSNLITQYICVSGVNQLSSRVSSVSTNIALTVRKALSLCLSVWWFGNAWSLQLGGGALMVFIGSLLYTTGS